MDNTENQTTISILGQIPGGETLLAWFHGWPEFGDAEVVEMRLIRSGPSVLRIVVEVSERGRYGGAPFKTAVVTFILRDVMEVALQGFSHQNVIGGLKIGMATDNPIHPSLIGIGLFTPDHEIELEPTVGAFGTIRATIDSITLTAAVGSDALLSSHP
jgi:hypothetical protein